MAKVDLKKLEELKAQRLLTSQSHKDEPLLIWNYTAECQYSKSWTPETLMCRGLITDFEGNIISRPFKKFFNLSEVKEVPNGDFQVYQKYDGSLGVMYWLNNKPVIASRGSFHSTYADKANQLLKNYDTSKLDPSKTYLFEIIYPENRIVVDYKGAEKLVMLAIIDTETGEEMPLESNEFETALVFNGLSIKDIINLPENKTDEGFVLKWSDGTRLKYKFDEYTRLHRLLTECTARDIWETLKDCKGLGPLLEQVPDEFYTWVKSKSSYFQSEFQRILRYAQDRVAIAKREAIVCDPETLDTPWLYTADLERINKKYKKEIQKHFKEKPEYEHICWAVYNRNREQTNDYIWKMLYPDHETPFINKPEL